MNNRILNACLLVLLLSLSLSALLPGPACAQSNTIISVTVENEWLSHLQNATVYVDGSYVGVTDRYGHFDIRGFTPGEHNLTVTDAGYADKTIERVFNSTDPSR